MDSASCFAPTVQVRKLPSVAATSVGSRVIVRMAGRSISQMSNGGSAFTVFTADMPIEIQTISKGLSTTPINGIIKSPFSLSCAAAEISSISDIAAPTLSSLPSNMFITEIVSS